MFAARKTLMLRALHPQQAQVLALTAQCRMQRQALGKQLLHHQPRITATLQPNSIRNGKARPVKAAAELLMVPPPVLTAPQTSTSAAETQQFTDSGTLSSAPALQPPVFLSDLTIRYSAATPFHASSATLKNSVGA